MFTDLYRSDVPWEIITDERGKVIGEVYLPDPPSRRRQNKWESKKQPIQKKAHCKK